MNETLITVVGNAVDDAQLSFTPSGVAVANLRIASTPRRYNKQTNAWEDGEALFLGVTCWKQHAENVAETVRRGMRLIVMGQLTQRTYEKKDGTRGSSYEIANAEIAVSLLHATAQVAKTTAGGSNGQQQRPTQQQGGGWGTATGATTATGNDPWATQGSDQAPF